MDAYEIEQAHSELRELIWAQERLEAIIFKKRTKLLGADPRKPEQATAMWPGAVRAPRMLEWLRALDAYCADFPSAEEAADALQLATYGLDADQRYTASEVANLVNEALDASATTEAP